MHNAITLVNFTYEENMGLVFRTPTESTTVLYRAFSPEAMSHFYTINQTEAVQAIRQWGYLVEGTSAYVYAAQICGSIPLYRLYNPSDVDNLYTTSEAERANAIENLGYDDVGIACYVLPDL